ncbi:MAG: IS3 family transposase [Cyanobacteria bacterium J06642_2]
MSEQIAEIFDTSRASYGSPRIHAVLRSRGLRVGRNRVGR